MSRFSQQQQRIGKTAAVVVALALLSSACQAESTTSVTPAASTATEPSSSTTTTSANGALLWSEEFDNGSTPNAQHWNYDLGAGGWGNSELQTYSNDASNVSVGNGVLAITARETTSKGGRRSFSSARINSQDKLTVQYGIIEARIKMPDLANGLWPAFWTLGNNLAQVGWPACGEFDIVEMGSKSAIADGVTNRRIHSTAHWQHNGGHAEYGLSIDNAVAMNNDFHLYRMEWTPDSVTTFVDGQPVWAMDIRAASCSDCSEFHQPHFLIVNLAVGGQFTDLLRASDITAPLPATMQVDWIRIYDNGFSKIAGSSQQPASAGSELRVASISTGVLGSGPSTKATAQVTVVNEFGQAVANAAVTGDFSGSHAQTLTATSDDNGAADFISTVKNRTTAFSFCVTDISVAGMTYNGAANQQSCSSY